MDNRLAVEHLKSMLLLSNVVTHAGLCTVRLVEGTRTFEVVGENEHQLGTIDIDEYSPAEAINTINQMIEDEHERL